jgi:peptidoglycan/LPS O-acetylase OafA/YrhL
MSHGSARFTAAVLIAALLAIPTQASAQSRGSSKAKRVTWTLVGAVAGFGLGAWFGFSKYDDATYSERKITTAAVTGALIGGIAGAVVSRDAKPSFMPPSRVPSGRGGYKVRIANPIRSGPPVFFEVH